MLASTSETTLNLPVDAVKTLLASKAIQMVSLILISDVSGDIMKSVLDMK